MNVTGISKASRFAEGSLYHLSIVTILAHSISPSGEVYKNAIFIKSCSASDGAAEPSVNQSTMHLPYLVVDPRTSRNPARITITQPAASF